MRIVFVVGIFCLILNGSACSRHEYTIDESKSFQTIRGFGASDAWSNERVNLSCDSDRNIASDWLFSNEMNPDGTRDIQGGGRPQLIRITNTKLPHFLFPRYES